MGAQHSREERSREERNKVKISKALLEEVTKEVREAERKVQEIVRNNGKARGLVLIVTNDYEGWIPKDKNGRVMTDEYGRPMTNELPMTAKDGEAMRKLFQDELQFACVKEENLTSNQITNLVLGAARCDLPESYKFVAIVFSGHGGKNNTIIGQDKKDVGVLEEVIEPFRPSNSKIKREVVKLFFIDACRGTKEYRYSHLIAKGSSELQDNLLVAYSTLPEYKSYGLGVEDDSLSFEQKKKQSKGSHWMISLAELLTYHKNRSVQSILNDAAGYLMSTCTIESGQQLPDFKDETTSAVFLYQGMEPLGSPTCISTVMHPTIAHMWSITVPTSDGGEHILHIISALSKETAATITEFCNELLRENPKALEEFKRKAHQSVTTQQKISLLLYNWLSYEDNSSQSKHKSPQGKSVSEFKSALDKNESQQKEKLRTWQELTKAMENAGINKGLIDTIKENTPS